MSVVDSLTQQILGQGTTGKWSGQGHGSPEANARNMAEILSGIGITDIRQFGKVDKYEPVEQIGFELNGKRVQNPRPGQYYEEIANYDGEGGLYYTRRDLTPEEAAQVKPVYAAITGYESSEFGTFPQYAPVDQSTVTVRDGQTVAKTGESFGNKVTGQEVPNTYSERQTGNAWGGTFAGKGNTGYRVDFAPDGTPYFYTTGASSSDIGKIAPFLALASFVPGVAPFAAAANAAIAIDQGNVLGGLASLAGIPGISEAANAAGAGSIVSGLKTANQVSNLVNAAESGNILGVLSSGANLTGTGGVQLGDTGYNVADVLKTANIINAADQGNVLPLINSLTKAGLSEGPKSSDFEVGSMGTPGGTIDTSQAGHLGTIEDINRSNQSPLGTLSGDYSFAPDYSLFPESTRPSLPEMGGGSGLKLPSLPDVFNDDGQVNYNLYSDTPGGGEPMLRMPTAPGLESMNGGTGLTLPVAGGTITSSGFIPTNGYTPDLGDPDSFINKPAPGGDVSDVVDRAINTPSTQPPKQPPEQPPGQPQGQPPGQPAQSGGPDLLSLLGLMGLMGGGQQQAAAPVQTPPAEVKSFEEQGYGDIFGTDLQFSGGGEVDELLQILRG